MSKSVILQQKKTTNLVTVKITNVMKSKFLAN